VQLTLPFGGRVGGALDAVLDDVKERFGSDAVTRAVLLGRDPGITMPTLPD
jgi:DNA polymerase-4